MSKPIPENWISMYKNLLFSTSVIVFSTISLFSCTPIKNTYYFNTLKKDSVISNTTKRGKELAIKKNDQIQVNISSLSPAEDAVYNATSVSLGSGISNGYLVDREGNIQLHKLGSIHVEGMTRAALKEKLQKDLFSLLKDPVVTVSFLNHKIIIMGEIGNPHVLSMSEEQISILELLASSGDVTQFGRRDNILIIRDTGRGKEFKHVNLEDLSVFSSPWYWLQPGDVVFVGNNTRKTNDQKNARVQQIISYGLTALTIGLIIIDRIIK